jgi:hypothetical protein
MSRYSVNNFTDINGKLPKIDYTAPVEKNRSSSKTLVKEITSNVM